MEDEAMALWLTARDGVINVAIIICLCYIVEVWQGPDFYFENAAVGSLLTKRMFKPSNFSSLEDQQRVGLLLPDYFGIATIPMVWDWLSATIVPLFTEPSTCLLISNRILGKVRLRQLRVRSDTCSMPELFDGVFAECYGPYSDANENKGSFGSRSGPTSTAWEWNNPASLDSTQFLGEVATYGGGGFYADLPRDRKKVLAEALLKELIDGHWLDEATRMLFLDVNLYNPDHNVFVLVNLYIEIPPTAGLLPSVAVNALKLIHDEYCRVGPHVILLVLSLWTALMQAVEMAYRGWWNYCRVIANCMHFFGMLVGVVISTVGIFQNCRTPTVESNRALYALQSEAFVGLMSERHVYDLHRYTVIILLFLSSGRLLFLSDFGSHSKLTATLYRSLPNIISFSFMFTILMLSFSQLANLVFGTDLYDFRTFKHSLFVLVEVIIGQLDYKSLTTTDRFLGPVFYMAFIFLVVFVLYNMFIVILNDTYYIVREEAAAANEVERFEVVPFIKHCLCNVWLCLRIPLPLPKVHAAPQRAIRLRALRTLLLDCKLPRAAVTDFVWRMRWGGISGSIDKDQAAALAASATHDLWKEPASWEYFMNLWHRLREVEKSVRQLDKALDELLLDLR